MSRERNGGRDIQDERLRALDNLVLKHEGRISSLEGRIWLLVGLQLAQTGGLLGLILRSM